MIGDAPSSSGEYDECEALVRRTRPIRLLAHITKQLLLQTKKVSEKCSEQFIKTIAAINGQFPQRSEGVCSEAADVFQGLAYEDSIDR